MPFKSLTTSISIIVLKEFIEQIGQELSSAIKINAVYFSIVQTY